MAANIEHVFVLMLENRSFDHMLGFSGITGTDAETGTPTKINGLTGAETNDASGLTFRVVPTAGFTIEVDPGHEFPEVVEQLCGRGTKYTSGQAYPPINNSGFASTYAEVVSAAQKQTSPGEIMKGYAPAQLPVLNALASEFAVCDNWHASMPGATWPNRLFVHAASSNGLDHSPTSSEIAVWEALDGFEFPNGHIFDRLRAKGLTRRLYAGDDFPMVAALKGISLGDIRDYALFANDLQAANFPHNYVFIEPSYDLPNDYRNSSSQHPLGDVTRGESLIKSTYEAIRNSPLWETSVLLILWDEHGGFYDHAAPPVAVAPGDSFPGKGHNKCGFTFERYGVRVPAVVVSPWIPKNTIDHRLYDHSSVPATIEALFGLSPMTNRDGSANNVLPLLSLDAARDDAPLKLPAPAASGIARAAAANTPALPGVVPAMAAAAHEVRMMQSAPALGGATTAVVGGAGEVRMVQGSMVARPDSSINDGNLPVVVQAAMRQDLELSPDSQRPDIIAKVAALKTRKDAAMYMNAVHDKIEAARAQQVQ